MKKKVFKMVGVVAFIAAMLINVQMNNAEAETSLLKDELATIAMAELEGDGGTGFVICRCHVDAGFRCYPGHRISFRSRCYGCENGVTMCYN